MTPCIKCKIYGDHMVKFFCGGWGCFHSFKLELLIFAVILLMSFFSGSMLQELRLYCLNKWILGQHSIFYKMERYWFSTKFSTK